MFLEWRPSMARRKCAAERHGPIDPMSDPGTTRPEQSGSESGSQRENDRSHERLSCGLSTRGRSTFIAVVNVGVHLVNAAAGAPAPLSVVRCSNRPAADLTIRMF
jgi:hypothetical protein